MPVPPPVAPDPELYRGLLHSSPNAIFVVSPEGSILDLNELGAALRARSRSDLLGTEVLALYPRQLQANRRALLNKVFDTGLAVSFEDELDGVFMKSTIFPIGSCAGRPSTVGVMAVDLTREIKRERALSAALERAAVLEDIVNRSPVMAFLWRDEPGYPVEYVSRNVKQLGYTVQDMVSGLVSWTGITHPDDLARLEMELEAHVRNGEPEWTMKYRLRLADGSWRWFEDHTRPKRDYSGKVTHYEALVTDITDKVRCQELLEATTLMDELSGLYNRRAFPALAQQLRLST
jgi:PAS domain S-box-containing protein